jgi:hypothetical protein
VNNQLSSTPSLSVYNGNVGIGVTTPQESLQLSRGTVRIDQLSGLGTRAVSVDAFGNITLTSSDERLKKNVNTLGYGLRDLQRMRPVSFEWKNPSKYGALTDIGMIAQDVLKVVPEAVSMDHDGYYALDYMKLVPVLIQSIQELSTKVDELQNTRCKCKMCDA